MNYSNFVNFCQHFEKCIIYLLAAEKEMKHLSPSDFVTEIGYLKCAMDYILQKYIPIHTKDNNPYYNGQEIKIWKAKTLGHLMNKISLQKIKSIHKELNSINEYRDLLPNYFDGNNFEDFNKETEVTAQSAAIYLYNQSDILEDLVEESFNTCFCHDVKLEDFIDENKSKQESIKDMAKYYKDDIIEDVVY